MRITGGSHAGRLLMPPKSRLTRPMMDRVRQALFNILNHHEWGPELGNVIQNRIVLDAFCGTGALAYEALSWGATHAMLFDNSLEALEVARLNAKNLGFEQSCTIQRADSCDVPVANEQKAQLVFLAPPYRKNLIPPALLSLEAHNWIDRQALLVLETAKREELILPPSFVVLFDRTYGDTKLIFVTRSVSS